MESCLGCEKEMKVSGCELSAKLHFPIVLSSLSKEVTLCLKLAWVAATMEFSMKSR